MFKYEVALSFHQIDENLAFQLYEQIRDRVETFYYTKRQDELVSEDGIEKFSQIYSTESRLVILLYRKEYGKTRWTAIEENAIKSRRFNEGFNFLILIPTEENHTTPKWIPDYIIWDNIKRYGIEHTASLIINKVKDSEGKINKNPLEAKIDRIRREKEFDKRLMDYRVSNSYYEDYKEMKQKLMDSLELKAKQIFGDKLGIDFKIDKDPRYFKIQIPIFRLSFSFSTPNHNDKSDTGLFVSFERFYSELYEFQKITKNVYIFTKDINWNSVWKNENNCFINDQLVDYSFYRLLDFYEKKGERGLITDLD